MKRGCGEADLEISLLGTRREREGDRGKEREGEREGESEGEREARLCACNKPLKVHF